MKISVRRIAADAGSGAARVWFACDCGEASATWIGAVPAAGDTRFIEWLVTSKDELQIDLCTPEEAPGVRCDGDTCIFVGDVSGSDSFGVECLRLGAGIVLPFPDELVLAAGRYRWITRGLRAYDCNF